MGRSDAAQLAQLQALADAIEELDVELALQLGQRAADGGLGHRQLLGRAADALEARDGQEDLELAEGVTAYRLVRIAYLGISRFADESRRR